MRAAAVEWEKRSNCCSVVRADEKSAPSNTLAKIGIRVKLPTQRRRRLKSTCPFKVGIKAPVLMYAKLPYGQSASAYSPAALWNGVISGGKESFPSCSLLSCSLLSCRHTHTAAEKGKWHAPISFHHASRLTPLHLTASSLSLSLRSSLSLNSNVHVHSAYMCVCVKSAQLEIQTGGIYNQVQWTNTHVTASQWNLCHCVYK